MPFDSPSQRLDIDGGLQYRVFLPTVQRTQRPWLLMHEGLGSIGQWRSFPQQLADQQGAQVYAFCRAGYGQSRPNPGPWPVEFMHRQAHEVLPQVISALGLERPVILGHSDGASIALLYAARYALNPALAPDSLIVLAPHVLVEPMCVAAIQQAVNTYTTSGLQQGLMRHHTQADALFSAWSGIWLDTAFLQWNITAVLADISCPVLAVQGLQDQYGTLQQINTLAQHIRPGLFMQHLIDHCQHSPHLEQTRQVLDAIKQWPALIQPSP
jgi:pimeloyl-ACP methyl ester carboxylesterase